MHHIEAHYISQEDKLASLQYNWIEGQCHKVNKKSNTIKKKTEKIAKL